MAFVFGSHSVCCLQNMWTMNGLVTKTNPWLHVNSFAEYDFLFNRSNKIDF